MFKINTLFIMLLLTVHAATFAAKTRSAQQRSARNSITQLADGPEAFAAIKCNDIQTLNQLLAKRELVTFRNESNETLLSRAIILGQEEMVQLLLAKGACVNERSGVLETSPIHTAIMHRQIAIARKLLVQKSIQLVLNDNGDTALHSAVAYGLHKLISDVVKSGCNINARNQQGNTALDWAELNNDTHAMQLLLKHGADDSAPKSKKQKLN